MKGHVKGAQQSVIVVGSILVDLVDLTDDMPGGTIQDNDRVGLSDESALNGKVSTLKALKSRSPPHRKRQRHGIGRECVEPELPAVGGRLAPVGRLRLRLRSPHHRPLAAALLLILAPHAFTCRRLGSRKSRLLLVGVHCSLLAVENIFLAWRTRRTKNCWLVRGHLSAS